MYVDGTSTQIPCACLLAKIYENYANIREHVCFHENVSFRESFRQHLCEIFRWNNPSCFISLLSSFRVSFRKYFSFRERCFCAKKHKTGPVKDKTGALRWWTRKGKKKRKKQVLSQDGVISSVSHFWFYLTFQEDTYQRRVETQCWN